MSGGLIVLAILAGARTVLPVRQVPASDTTAELAHAAATITGTDLAAYQAALLADSMRGRAPSAAINRAADYVGAQLRALGFAVEPITSPHGAIDWRRQVGGSYEYPIPSQFRVDYRQSRFELVTISHGSTAALVMETGRQPRAQAMGSVLAGTVRMLDTVVAPRLVDPAEPGEPGILLAGRFSPASVQAIDVEHRLVVYVPSPEADSATQASIIRDLAARSGGVVVVSTADSATFAVRQQAAQAQPPLLLPSGWSIGRAWAVEVRPEVVDQVLRRNGVDLADLRTAGTPVVRPLPFLTARMTWVAMPMTDTVTAPNVVAVLPGSEPHRVGPPKYVTITVSLDGHEPGSPANALNVAALLTLAKAFRQPGAQPRRLLAFLITSDGTAQWGSRDFLTRTSSFLPPTLAVKLDFWRSPIDTVLAVDGAPDIEMTPSPAWISRLHPELGVTLVDTGSVLSPGAGVAAFTARWVPTLVFRLGSSNTQQDRQAVAGGGAGDSARAVQVLQTLFYVIHALADADPPPRWTAAARRQLSTASP